MDIFDTRSMMEGIEQAKLPRRFLMQLFFNAGQPRTFATETVEIDIIKGQRKMAPFVHPRLPGSVVLRNGYRTDIYKPPYIQPKMETRADLILKRAAGENPYTLRSPEERAGNQLGLDLAELDHQITRREEWMCAQALTTGQVHVIGEGVNEVIDYLMEDEHKITLDASLKWTAEGTDPIGNLRVWKRQIAKASGRTANAAVLSGTAVDALLANEKVMKQLNTRLVTLGQINPQELPEGVTYLGYLNDPGIALYGYDEWYAVESGQEAPMIPEGGLILGSTNTGNALLYGAIQDVQAIESGLVEAARFPKTWVVDDPSARWLKLSSAPLPGLLEPDAFIYAKVA